MADWKKVIVSGSSAELQDLTLDTALTVANGGTGASTLTDGGVLLGSGTGAITATAVLANGQLLIGDGTGDPSVSTLTAGTGVTITNTAGAIEIAAAGSGGTVTSVATAGTVNGLTLTGGPITAAGTITLGGTLSNIANGALTNSSVSYGGVSVALGASDATPAFDLSDATSLPLGAGTTGTLAATRGGTGLTSYTTGDIIYASASNTLLGLGIGTTGQVLTVAGGIVSWATPTTGDVESVANTTEGGIAVTNGTGPDVTLAVDINNLGAAGIATGDFIAFSDEGTAGDPTKKESIDDVATLFAGTGLTAASAVMSVDYGSSAGNAVEGNTTITLTQTSGEIDITGTAAQALGGAPSYTIGLANTISGDRTFSGDTITINKDLIVQGTASFQSTTNLEVSDRFVLFASGSNANGDGGIVVQQDTQNIGELFGYDSGTTRWGVTGSFSADGSAYTPDAFMSAVVEGAANDPTAVVSKYTKKGNIFVANNEDIYIYS